MDKKTLKECINGDKKIEFGMHNFKLIMPADNPGKINRIRNLLIKEKKIVNIFKENNKKSKKQTRRK